MKAKIFIANALCLLFCAIGMTAAAQGWSLPKESEETNWTTPENTYASILGSDAYSLGKRTFTLRIPNDFLNDAPINKESYATFGIANPNPAKGYTTTTFTAEPRSEILIKGGYPSTLDNLRSSIMINGEEAVSYSKHSYLILTFRAGYKEIVNIPQESYYCTIKNQTTELEYWLVRAKDDPSGYTYILWAVASWSPRYKKQSASTASSKPSAPAASTPKTTTASQSNKETAQEQGWLGAALFDWQPSDLEYFFGIAGAKGTFVKGVLMGSPAWKGGLAPGFFITRVNGTAVSSSKEAANLVAKTGAGSSVKFDGLFYDDSKRKWEKQTLSIKLEARKDSSASAKIYPGLLVIPNSGAVKGLRILAVDEGNSVASALGLKTGDVVTEVLDVPVATLGEFYSRLHALQTVVSDSIGFKVFSGGKYRTAEKFWLEL